jgi:hypothetical protein
MPLKEITRLRLSNQQLMGTKFDSPGELVAWMGAVQAQDFLDSKWAVGMRLNGATEAGVQQAYDAGEILRTHILRPTWHFVAPEDLGWMLPLSAPRVHQVNGTIYRQVKLEASDFARSQAAIARALEGGNYLTRTELAQVLEGVGIAAKGQRLAYIVMHAELEGLICSGPRKGKQFTYMLLNERAPQMKALDRDWALLELTRRYFNSRGPATEYDFAAWSGLTVSDARIGVDMLGAELESTEWGGVRYWGPPADFSDEAAPLQVFFLPILDEMIIGYKDRSAILTPEKAASLWDEFAGGVILIDGQVEGNWKRRPAKKSMPVEVQFFRPLDRAERQAVALTAQRYSEFMEMPVDLVFMGAA